MVKCPKCKCEEYEILYSDGYDFDEDNIRVSVRVECTECGKKFWVEELYKFKSARNVKGE